jgi:hypothetical protein
MALGTRVVSCRVVEITQLGAFMVLPVYATNRFTLGMVLDGPYAGKEVDLTSSLLADKNGILVPTTRPSERPGLMVGN